MRCTSVPGLEFVGRRKWRRKLTGKEAERKAMVIVDMKDIQLVPAIHYWIH